MSNGTALPPPQKLKLYSVTAVIKYFHKIIYNSLHPYTAGKLNNLDGYTCCSARRGENTEQMYPSIAQEGLKCNSIFDIAIYHNHYYTSKRL